MSLPVSESFILTVVGILTGFVGAVLTFCLRSRCSSIKCCCVECVRDVVPTNDIGSVSIEMPTVHPRLVQTTRSP